MGVTPAVNPRRRFAATFPLSQCALLDKLGGECLQWRSSGTFQISRIVTAKAVTSWLIENMAQRGYTIQREVATNAETIETAETAVGMVLICATE